MKSKEKAPCGCGMEEKIREVELDKGKPRRDPATPVSESTIAEDLDILNPDVNSLDRG